MEINEEMQTYRKGSPIIPYSLYHLGQMFCSARAKPISGGYSAKLLGGQVLGGTTNSYPLH